MQNAAPAKPFGPSIVQHVPPALWSTVDETIDAYLEQRVGAHAGIEAVSQALRRLTTFQDPDIGQRLSERLAALDIGGPIGFFSRERIKRAHRLSWYLLGAMAVNGHGSLPPGLLGLPLSTRGNDQKKNEDAPLAAIAVVGWIAQDDRKTVNTLIDRLKTAQGDLWLISDITAALSALTHQGHGHDLERWRSWWTAHQ